MSLEIPGGGAVNRVRAKGAPHMLMSALWMTVRVCGEFWGLRSTRSRGAARRGGAAEG